jgi:hypothetical protein
MHSMFKPDPIEKAWRLTYMYMLQLLEVRLNALERKEGAYNYFCQLAYKGRFRITRGQFWKNFCNRFPNFVASYKSHLPPSPHVSIKQPLEKHSGENTISIADELNINSLPIPDVALTPPVASPLTAFYNVLTPPSLERTSLSNTHWNEIYDTVMMHRDLDIEQRVQAGYVQFCRFHHHASTPVDIENFKQQLIDRYPDITSTRSYKP